MSNAFDLAASAIFSDGNMAVSAIYKSRNKSDISIRVIKSTSRDDPDFGDTTLIDEKTYIDIQKSEVSAPKVGDFIIMDGITYEIYEAPKIDVLSIIWTCSVRF